MPTHVNEYKSLYKLIEIEYRPDWRQNIDALA